VASECNFPAGSNDLVAWAGAFQAEPGHRVHRVKARYRARADRGGGFRHHLHLLLQARHRGRPELSRRRCRNPQRRTNEMQDFAAHPGHALAAPFRAARTGWVVRRTVGPVTPLADRMYLLQQAPFSW